VSILAIVVLTLGGSGHKAGHSSYDRKLLSAADLQSLDELLKRALCCFKAVVIGTIVALMDFMRHLLNACSKQLDE